MSNNNVIIDDNWLQSSESRRQHLEFIENIITRMNSNSYQIKQFAILIVTALLGVYATNKNTIFVFIGIFPTVACWFLDSYCLLMERKFRGLYNDVIGVTHIQFVPPYGMDIRPYTCYFKILVSPATLFYLVLVIALGMIGRLL